VQEEGQEEMEEYEEEPTEVTIRLEVTVRDQQALDRLIQQGLYAYVLKPKSGGDAVATSISLLSRKAEKDCSAQ
jgi:hypothetical protein